MTKWLPPFILIIASSCAVKVIHFTNDESDFAKYETFTIAGTKPNSADLSGDGQKILAAVEKSVFDQMKKRNYEYAGGSANLLIRYEIISNMETDVSYNRNNFYYSPFYGPTFSVRTFLESALLLEMLDLNTKKLVWQASVDMSNFESIKNQEQLIEKAVEQLYNTYLHKAGTSAVDPTLIEGKKK